MNINIGFTGDFCPWNRVEDLFFTGNWQDAFASVLPFFQENHLNIADMECPLTMNGIPIPKTGPHLKSVPETAEILKHLNIALVATANNHFMDYGREGMIATHQALKAAHVQWLGSGNNLQEASRIHFQSLEDTRVAFINLAENEWSTTKGTEAGVNPLDPVAAFQQIKTAKEQADFVVVIVHGGHEHYSLPSPRMKQLYRFFIEAGAAAVIGHHPHIISGYEVYRNAPIFYSLGNFCFDWPGFRNRPWNEGMLVRLLLEKGKVPSFELHFVRQNDEHPGVQLMYQQEQDKKMEEVLALSHTIADDAALEQAFEAYSTDLRDVLLTWIEPYEGKYLSFARKRGWLPSLFGRRKKLLLTNLIRCEAHRDVLLKALEDVIR